MILDTEVNAAAEDTWVERVFDLPEAEQVTLLFYYVGSNGHDWNIDDVCVEEVVQFFPGKSTHIHSLPPPPFFKTKKRLLCFEREEEGKKRKNGGRHIAW